MSIIIVDYYRELMGSQLVIEEDLGSLKMDLIKFFEWKFEA